MLSTLYEKSAQTDRSRQSYPYSYMAHNARKINYKAWLSVCWGALCLKLLSWQDRINLAKISEYWGRVHRKTTTFLFWVCRSNFHPLNLIIPFGLIIWDSRPELILGLPPAPSTSLLTLRPLEKPHLNAGPWVFFGSRDSWKWIELIMILFWDNHFLASKQNAIFQCSEMTISN